MDAITCIKTRRSVRKFTDEPVSDQDIRDIVEIARFAPTWKNTQTVRYIVESDREKLNTIADKYVLGWAGNTKIIKGAPRLVVLTTVKNISGYEKDGTFSTPKLKHWESFDAGLAAEAFCLAAHEKGLGTVIMGLFDPDGVAEVVGVPKDQKVSAIIAIGHPAMDVMKKKAPDRLDVDTLLDIR